MGQWSVMLTMMKNHAARFTEKFRKNLTFDMVSCQWDIVQDAKIPIVKMLIIFGLLSGKS